MTKRQQRKSVVPFSPRRDNKQEANDPFAAFFAGEEAFERIKECFGEAGNRWDRGGRLPPNRGAVDWKMVLAYFNRATDPEWARRHQGVRLAARLHGQADHDLDAEVADLARKGAMFEVVAGLYRAEKEFFGLQAALGKAIERSLRSLERCGYSRDNPPPGGREEDLDADAWKPKPPEDWFRP